MMVRQMSLVTPYTQQYNCQVLAVHCTMIKQYTPAVQSGSSTHQQAVHDGQADVAGHHHAALVLVEQVAAAEQQHTRKQSCQRTGVEEQQRARPAQNRQIMECADAVLAHANWAREQHAEDSISKHSKHSTV
jgi:hypothetical protein